MLLWQALTNLSDTYSRMTMVSESHSKLIDRIMDDAWTHHERYKRLNREVKVFNRSPSFKRSIINEILFSMHLTFDEEYFTEIIF
jgi:hypothetical protein